MMAFLSKTKMHIDFDPSKIDWYSLTQATPDVAVLQYGGYSVFSGIPFQRGAGVGSIFRSLLRYLIPIGKEIGSAIGRQGLETGNRVLTNVLEGKDLKQTLVDESKTGLKNLLENAANNLNSQKGQGFDFKRYQKEEKPFGRKKRGKHINRMQSTVGPPSFLPSLPVDRKKKKNKRLRVDTLGTY